MIHSFIFGDGKIAGRDLEIEALRLVRSDKGLILWVDLDNPTDEEIKAVLEGIFQFHPLAIEDCVAPSSLPKIEDYEDYLFITTHAVEYSKKDNFVATELDFFLSKEYLVTFHRTPLRSVQSLTERLGKNPGTLLRGPDGLAHALLDVTVDNFAPVADTLRGQIEEIEEIVLAKDCSKQFVAELLQVRRDLAKFQQIVRPQRDLVERLARGDTKLVRSVLLPYFRDLRDNLVRLDYTAGSYHDRLLLAFDIYLNKAAFEANEGIKFLTALTAVTLPAVLVGGWYGMNFDHMPELHSPHGYFYAATGTLLSTLLMALYLKWKNWF
jgi:magnesium transporter